MAATIAPPPVQSRRSPAGPASRVLEAARWIGAVERDPLCFATAPLLPAALGFAAGILIARWHWFSPAWTCIAILLEAVVAGIAIRRQPRAATLAVVVLWLLTGIFAADLQPHPSPQRELRLLAQGTPVTLTGTVARTNPIRRITSLRPYSTDEITEQMQSVDLHITAAADLGDRPQPLAGGVRLSLYAPERHGASTVLAI